MTASLALLIALSYAVAAQSAPSKIDGYKVHNANVKIAAGEPGIGGTYETDALVNISSVTFADISLSGLTIEIGAEIRSLKEDLKVDRVTFGDVIVNGFQVSVEDYLHPFSVRKGKLVMLPKPARITIRPSQLPLAAYDELVNSPKTLTVKGSARIFGRVKRFGFSFKRVVPVKFDLEFKNPLRRG